MNVHYEALLKSIIGASIPKPSTAIAGHTAAAPFEQQVYQAIKQQLPEHTFRQYEYLNDLYRKNPTTIGAEARYNLLHSPSILFLLSRGKEATKKWTIDAPFEEKQDDTADVLVVKDGLYEIIDVKTRNCHKKAQAPNILSAYKLAQLCAIMIDNKEFNTLTISYFGID